MKRIFTITSIGMALFILQSVTGLAQTAGDYRTHQSGNWNDVNTWEMYNGSTWVNPVSLIPDSTNVPAANVITILSGHTVTFIATDTLRNVVVNQGGTLLDSLTTGDGKTACTLRIAKPGITINGTLTIAGNVTQSSAPYGIAYGKDSLYVGSTGVVNINETATSTGTKGFLPTAAWTAGSVLNVNSIGGTATTGWGSGGSQGFANINYDVTYGATGNFGWGFGAGKVVNGDFVVMATNNGTTAGRLQIFGGSSGSVKINGNLIVTGGYLTGSGTGSSSTFDTVYVMGNLRVTAGGSTGGFAVDRGSHGSANDHSGVVWYFYGDSVIVSTTSTNAGNMGNSNSQNSTYPYYLDSRFVFAKSGTQFVKIKPTTCTSGNGLDFDVINGSQVSVIDTSYVTYLRLINGKINSRTAPLMSGWYTGTSLYSGTIEDSSSLVVDGKLGFLVATISPVTKTFPIGAGTAYRPITLSLTQSAATLSTYVAEVVDSSAMALGNAGWSSPEAFSHVSRARYYILKSSGGSAFTNGSLRVFYGADDQVQTPADLRIAQGPGGSGTWIDLGGTGSGTGASKLDSIASATAFTDLTTDTVFSLATVANDNPILGVVATNGTGGGEWSSPATWNGGIIPDSTNDVLIASSDSVYVASTTAAKCKNLTVQSKAKLNVLGSPILKGAFVTQPNAWFYNSNSNLPSFPLASSYAIDTASYYVHTSSASALLGSAGYDSVFGNVIVRRGGTVAGTNLAVNGRLTVQTSGGFFSGAGSSSLVHHVHGNVYVLGGVWSCVDTNGSNTVTGIWNMDSSVIVSSGFLAPFSSGGTAGNRVGVFNIKGILLIENGGQLEAGTSSNSTLTTETGIINLSGGLTIDSTVTFGTNSKGSFAINFVGNGNQLVSLGKPFLFSSSSMPVTLNDTVAVSSNLTLSGSKSWASTSAGAANGGGAFVVNGIVTFGAADTVKGLQSFVLDSGSTIATVNPNGISPSGSVQVTGAKSYSVKANYVYDGTTAAQVTGSDLPSNINRLTIVNYAGVSLSKNLSLSDSLRIPAGVLHLGPDTLTVPGVMAPSSANYVVTDSTGVLKINGVGTNQALFPIGTRTAYDPVWITNSGTAGSFFVSASPDTTETTNGPGRVDVKWHIAGAGGSVCTIQFGWMSAEEDTVFASHRSSYAKIYLLYKDSTAEAGSGSYIEQFTQQPYTISRGGITTLGTFSVGHFTMTAVDEQTVVPAVFKLYQNYPNPFNPSTTIEFTVAKVAHTTLKLYNILGQQVAMLFDNEAQPGRKYVEHFDGSMLSSGVYFSALESAGQREIHKMVLLK